MLILSLLAANALALQVAPECELTIVDTMPLPNMVDVPVDSVITVVADRENCSDNNASVVVTSVDSGETVEPGRLDINVGGDGLLLVSVVPDANLEPFSRYSVSLSVGSGFAERFFDTGDSLLSDTEDTSADVELVVESVERGRRQNPPLALASVTKGTPGSIVVITQEGRDANTLALADTVGNSIDMFDVPGERRPDEVCLQAHEHTLRGFVSSSDVQCAPVGRRGCSVTGVAASGWLALCGVALLRRRRTS